MKFNTIAEFLDVFGSSATAARLGQALGISPKIAASMAKKRGLTPPRSEKPIPGLEHLPGLPSFATTRKWARGITHRIDCRISGDSPGYRSLLIHQSSIYLEDPHDDD